MNTPHTPTPWNLEVNSAWANTCKDRGPIFECRLTPGAHIPVDQNERNAAYIVRAVNAHEELLGNLRYMADWFFDNGFPEKSEWTNAIIFKAEGK